MIRLYTPRQVIDEIAAGAKAPEQAQMARDVRQRLKERGSLDLVMGLSSVEGLLREVGEEVLTPEPEPTYRTEPVN